MPDQTISSTFSNRLNIISTIITNEKISKKVETAFTNAKGDWKATIATLSKENIDEPILKKIDFTHSLAELTGDNEKLVAIITKLPNISSMREFALHHNTEAISKLITDTSIPADTPGTTVRERKKNYAVAIQNKLFATETSAVVHRMVDEAEVPITDGTVRNEVAIFFSKNPEFNIRTTSVYTAIKNTHTFKEMEEVHRNGVIDQLKTLQRVQAISHIPAVMPVLMKANLTTAYHVAEMTEKDFIKAFGAKMGESEAKVVYTNATNIKIRNEQALMAMHEYLNEPHIAAINRSPAKPQKLLEVQEMSDHLQIPVNWENLFGSVDFCECGECNSVYSPASYFVELLQYLRNNNLDPSLKPDGTLKFPNTGQKGIDNTPLEKLFRRRPDLGCLELTCVNTNTVLPYIDLVNEVMESFVVHLKEYHTDVHDPKQAEIDPWNVEDETTGELLAQPQHTNYNAYCILKNAVYPFTLPYHQPIDAIRIFLKYLETSRYELMAVFRSSGLIENKMEELPEDASMPPPAPDPDAAELLRLNNNALDRAIDAEFLEITQEEFIILTKQAFWDKKYFEIKCKRSFTEDEYRTKIAVKKVYEYYGYGSEADLLSTDETSKIGLTFVKDQFLKRTGLIYVDLVELLKTQFINPNYPRGKAVTILESIRFSYRFLQTMIDTTSSDPKIRFGKLIAFLKNAQPFLPLLDALLHPDPCKPNSIDWCVQMKDLEKWIYCYFEKIGKVIVLTNAEHCTCIDGHFFIDGSGNIIPVYDQSNKMIVRGEMFLTSDCDILLKQQDEIKIIGHLIKEDGAITGSDLNGRKVGFTVYGQKDANNQSVLALDFISTDGKSKGTLSGGKLLDANKHSFASVCITEDNCDLNDVRLKHLDGTDVTVEEYDKMQRFIRLWRKLGWTIDETDKAIAGLAAYKMEGDVELPANDDCTHCFDEFGNECDGEGNDEDLGCDPATGSIVFYDITPDFLHQLVAIKKLLDSTGIELTKLLTFWTNISTGGEKSLYKRLFLTHNLLGIDKIFQADKNGNYLAKTAKITDHVPVLMAAFNLKADDVTNIMEIKSIKDELTISNITVLYRYSLLMRILHVKSAVLKEIVALFDNPFKTADATNEFLGLWGKMEDAGFTFQQLNYFIRSVDDDKNPIAPKKKVVLQLAKTLYDGLNQIDKDHPDLNKIDEETIGQLEKTPALSEDEKTGLLKDKATGDLIRTKTSLLFDQTTVASIIGLLQGTANYATNAPKNLVTKAEEFNSKLSDTLKQKIKYDFINGGIQVTGLLTEKEKTDAKALFNPADWPKAIDRVGKQALYFFNDALTGIFKGVIDEAKKILLQGDISIPDDLQDPLNPIVNTAPIKRKYFIEKFLPFLREQLTHRYLVDNLSAASGIERKVTDVLISEVLVDETPSRNLVEIFKDIQKLPPAGGSGWNGYLIPATDDKYIFAVVNDAQSSPDIKIDGQALSFRQQEDPSNLWLSDPDNPIKLQSGRPYFFEATGLSPDLKELSWKTPTSPKATIPASVLLPDYSFVSVNKSFVILQKAGLIVNGFALNDEEVSYLQNHGSDFDALNFNGITLKAWKRIEAYARFRNSLPQTDTNLPEFFAWTNKITDATHLSEKIAALTFWKKEDIDKLIQPAHFNLSHTEDFRNEMNLLKLQKALYVADKISMDINLLFDWARPTSRFWICHDLAESIRKSIRARYRQEDWEQVVKPLNDQLREDQKNALISYLLVQQDLIDWPVVDADSLFEFFLIDVQMDACMETSRMKQAISSVQLFVQRCFLGLEDKYGVASDVLDRLRWDWMSRNVIWQANRKVFLYPENWIEEELRDDKSPFYKELESELLQKDISRQSVEDALKSYLYKVDEVANMTVIGLNIDGDKDINGNWTKGSKLHVFARTRNAPYFFYYRYLALDEKNWYPWEKIQVDIPSYDVEDTANKITGNGSYLIPVTWNGRLLIFFPQLVRKITPNVITNTKKIKDIQNDSPDDSKPGELWEIKIGWSEYRNGKWTQKQVSVDAVYESLPSGPGLFPVDKFRFAPRIMTGADSKLAIEVFPGNSALREFAFNGSQIYSDPDAIFSTDFPSPANFHIYPANHDVHSLQRTGVGPRPFANTEPFFAMTNAGVTFGMNGTQIKASHTFTHDLLGKINLEDFDHFFNYNLTIPDADDAFGGYDDNNPATSSSYHELKRPYSLYNWELFFHTPVTIADKLSKSQQFEAAMKWYHYVFNPLANGIDANRAWQFYPFTKTDKDSFLETFFKSLQPNTADSIGGQINEWRDKPFRPHVLARLRTSAYMKSVVMKYIDNLIAWGDYLYRQDTIESINYATQLYILANHILGPRPQMIPRQGEIKPQTYKSLLDKWDAFGNAMVELELAFPFSNQVSTPIGTSNGVVGLANIFGFASSLYFCIPNNPKLMGYWDTVADRLYKIRHCENIEGVFRKLALWDPPVDPALLVQAVAQGLSIDSVLNDLNTPMPNYRFNYILQKASELCNELKSMGNSLLSVFEKKDAEVLANMRARHESSMHNLVMEIKKMQVDEANKALDGLIQNRKSPEYRLRHYLQLIGGDINTIPADEKADFTEITNQLETPIDESGLKLIAYEKEEMDKASDAHDWQKAIGIVETIAGILHLIPHISLDVKPIGIGAGLAFGGQELGIAMEAVAKGLQIKVGDLSFQSSSAQRKAGFLRQLQDRVFQANLAGYEIKQIDKQITSQQIRIQIANQEITNQQQQIDNAAEVEEFLKNKYTNEELYSWLEGSIKTLYHQVYTFAYDLAKKAEKVFRFERGLTSSNIIQFGYWDASRDGLHAGERLYVGIKQLEAAYQEKRGYDFEVIKHISLRQVNPLALLELKENGTCEFELPEVLFDMDYPGHYMRRIKSVSLSVPCIAGPYTSINATLRLLENKFRVSSITTNDKDYVERTEETDERFTTVNIPITSIAASSGQNDSGVFELNFKDERYMPFEGAGAVSKWRLEFPKDFRQFDYDTITNAIIHMRYTSVDGGDKLKTAASASLKNYIAAVEELSQREGLFAVFDLKHDFPNDWYKVIQLPAGAGGRVMQLGNLLDKLPVYTKTFDPKKIKSKDIYMAASSTLKNTDVTLLNKGTELDPFGGAIKINGAMNLFHLSDQDETMDNWSLKFADSIAEPDKMWMLVRYVLAK